MLNGTHARLLVGGGAALGAFAGTAGALQQTEPLDNGFTRVELGSAMDATLWASVVGTALGGLAGAVGFGRFVPSVGTGAFTLAATTAAAYTAYSLLD